MYCDGSFFFAHTVYGSPGVFYFNHMLIMFLSLFILISFCCCKWRVSWETMLDLKIKKTVSKFDIFMCQPAFYRVCILLNVILHTQQPNPALWGQPAGLGGQHRAALSEPKLWSSSGSWRCPWSCWSPWLLSCPGLLWVWSCLTLWNTKQYLVSSDIPESVAAHEHFSISLIFFHPHVFRHPANHNGPGSSCKRCRGWSVEPSQ